MSTPKTYLRLLACLGVLMAAGCEKDYSGQGKTASPLGFSLESPDRGNEIRNGSEVVSLGVFGFSTGQEAFDPLSSTQTPNLMYNCKATRSVGGAWSYSPNVYWPIDLSINNSFFAYSPHIDDMPVEANAQVTPRNASSYPAIYYSVPSLVKDQVDLLCATPVLNCNRDTNDGKVLYRMKHALAWINILVAPVKISNDNEAYTVRSLYFTAKNFANRGYFNLGSGVYTNISTTHAEYHFTPHLQAMAVGSVGYPSDDKYIMVIPQGLSRESNEPAIDISFTFFNGTIDDPDEYYYSIPFPETPLSAGRISTYILRISTGGASITFASDNTIEDWLNGGQLPDIEVY